ncbi:MAG: potassium channel protein [Candidatus Hecatellales archaeon ex4484_218]|nr:MAG: potassium channel protein [Candidatus Hecatellales archaeon ex4484_218]
MLILPIILFVGVIGYSILLNLTLLDAFYFTVVTISTVGYGEIYPTTPASKIFTSVIILVGIGALALALETATEEILKRSVKEIVGKPEIRKPLENHYIVCGYGDIGEVVVEELKRSGEPFVVIEKNEEVIRELAEKKIPVIQGDALKEETLKEAGILKAKGIAATFERDVDNLFLVITAKSLKPDIYVVARANHAETIDKMYKVGADSVISPELEGGRMIAKALIRPFILDLLDRITLTKDMDILQICIPSDSRLEGKTLSEAKIEEKTGAKILALSQEGKVNVKPTPDTILHKGNVLLMVGKPEQLKKLQELLESGK